MALVQWVVVILLGIAVVAVVAPLKKKAKTADLAEALNNIQQIGGMLAEFDTDYGRFPDDETALEVKRRTKTGFTLTGEYSNDYFRQLLADGRGRSERPFWCETPLSPTRPLDDFSTAARALAAGEVGFSYIMASRTRGQSSKDDPRRTVVIAPSYRFQTDWTFDPKPYGGKAVALRVDNSATALQIRDDPKGGRHRKVMIDADRTLGDMGANTAWGTGMNPWMRAPLPAPISP